jgi:hypothetical protein
MRWIRLCALLAIAALAAGCSDDAEETSSSGAGAAPGSQGGTIEPLDLSLVQWLHQDVSSWSETVGLKSVTFPPSNICLGHNLSADAWPTAFVNDSEVVANAWVFMEHEGQWYGGAFEWLDAADGVQTCLGIDTVDGAHVNEPPFNLAPFPPSAFWQPTSGETLYFMLSGIVRGTDNNMAERSNLLGAVWP